MVDIADHGAVQADAYENRDRNNRRRNDQKEIVPECIDIDGIQVQRQRHDQRQRNTACICDDCNHLFFKAGKIQELFFHRLLTNYVVRMKIKPRRYDILMTSA